MGSRLHFGILGPLAVWRDGALVSIGGPRQRALMALFLCNANRVISRDRLLVELLADQPAGSADRVLRVQLSRLRKALLVADEEPRLIARPPGYILRVDEGELDLHSFERLLRDGRRAIERGDPAETAALLGEAEALWRGRPLADLEFEPFASFEVRRLDELRLGAYEDRIEAELALGRHVTLCTELEALTREHPLRERLRAQLMLALYRSGRQADALAAYRQTSELLCNELGLKPGRELRDLEHAILQQDASLQAPSPTSGSTVPLPVPATRFVGRERDTSLERTREPEAEERKTVTVLFCDLVGSNDASDKADPEAARARIRVHHGRLRREIESYGGTVASFIGDTMMAVFGAPTVHEDDPERAVRAGLRLLSANSAIEERERERGLSMRLGIDTGDAMVALGAPVGPGEEMVTGDVVSTASRLQAVAPVNGVVVGSRTYDATKTIFEYEAMEPVTLKNKFEPVPLFWAKQARARLGSDLLRSVTTPMVGRKTDLGILTAALDKAVQDSTVQLVTIVGEPGIGKSRLVAELSRVIDRWPDLIRWRQGRCLPYGEGITFWALGEILKAEAGILDTDPPELAGSKIDGVIPDGHPDAPWLRQRLRPLVGVAGPEAARQENFAAWRVFLELLAEDSPSVFVIEDLHWADDALLAFLEHVAEYAMGVPMLLVATARPELHERAPTWAVAARNVAKVNLSPLSDADTRKLISNLLESAVLPADVQQAILRRSGGNPLYAEEFVRLLKDRKILTKGGHVWTIDPDAEVPVPSSVQGLIAARLDALSPERKRLLQDAAVLGKRFWSGAVAEMATQDQNDVDAALHELTRRDLVHPARRSSMEGQAEYAFAHALVHDVCYAQIPLAQRSERHRRAAAWIERLADARTADHAEVLAVHYATALELAPPAAQSLADELAAKALRYLVLAGDRAIGIDAQSAERHYARALVMTDVNPSVRAEIHARHGAALQACGRFQEAAGAYENAIAAHRAQGDARAAAVAMSRCASVRYKLGDPRYPDLLADALAILGSLAPSPELVEVLTTYAGASLVSERHREGIVFADRAIALASAQALPEPSSALAHRGFSRFALGDEGGLSDMHSALAAAIASGLGREIAVIRVNLAIGLRMLEGPRRRLEMMRTGMAFAQRRGMMDCVLEFGAGSVGALVELGRIAEAMALADSLVSRMEEANDVLGLLEVRSDQARVLARAGQLLKARPIAEWVVKRAREFGTPHFVATAFPLAAAVRVQMGDATDAATLLAELHRTPNIAHAWNYAVTVLPDGVRTLLEAREPDLAAQLVHALEPVHPMSEHAVVASQALLAEHRGQHAEAATLFADAASRWERFEIPWERAQALLGHGRCALALGRVSEAAGAVRAAQEILVSLGAKAALLQSNALLRDANLATP